MLFTKKIRKEDKSQLIINIESIEKEKFRDICEKNEVTMTDVLTFAIKQINKKGDILSVDFRAEQ